MASIKKLATALVLAVVMAGVGLEAAPKKKADSGDAHAAVCSYLLSVMTYPYVDAMILAYATSLYNSYGCSAQ